MKRKPYLNAWNATYRFIGTALWVGNLLLATLGELNAKEPEVAAVPAQIDASFAHLADRSKPSMRWKAETPAQHQQWQQNLHPVVVDLLGKMPDRVPLEVKWSEEKSFDTYTRHKIYVRTEAAYWAPVYYFVPHHRAAPLPAIVCLHGHSGIVPYIGEAKNAHEEAKIRDSQLDYAVYLAKHGYVTAAINVRGWNETAGNQDSGVKNLRRSCTQVTMDSFLLGMTPQGLRCWDAMRVIDFLQSRQEEVDPDKIGVAGLSGGGTLSMYLPVLDDRVKLAMIAGAFSTYRSSIFPIRHCICNCLPRIMQYAEMDDVVALYAPRPVLLINGVEDPIFPIAGAREGLETLQQVYKLLGKPDNIQADFFDGGHAWSNNKTLEFLAQHFGLPTTPPSQ
ncbi:Abhydrolase family protein [Rosistilla carotiformis]|uniref:Abhydrolase family protein n=1 Tax=Rosistilla carotiformis TaxID=2528017 RepID=A0A518JUI9_9BACT|nr:alpha/beta hydrolase family protein [Rosistilla carotiformis]QDV69156.1 Abhydrolase family protein [Rosistilla carotiformis]